MSAHMYSSRNRESIWCGVSMPRSTTSTSDGLSTQHHAMAVISAVVKSPPRYDSGRFSMSTSKIRTLLPTGGRLPALLPLPPRQEGAQQLHRRDCVLARRRLPHPVRLLLGPVGSVRAVHAPDPECAAQAVEHLSICL